MYVGQQARTRLLIFFKNLYFPKERCGQDYCQCEYGTLLIKKMDETLIVGVACLEVVLQWYKSDGKTRA